MSFEEIVIKYVNELESVYADIQKAGHSTLELSFRPFLDKFIRAVAKFFAEDAAVTLLRKITSCPFAS